MGKEIKVKDILKICNGNLILGDENTIVTTFERNTKNIKTGDLYIGLKGEVRDGSIFWEEALKNGAIGSIINNIEIDKDVLNKYKDKILIVVEDTVKAIQQIAQYKRVLYDIPVVAITGSVGKTSTKDIISSVVNEEYKALKTEGNLNNHIGLPITVLGLNQHEAMVVEMGMNHLGEIDVLTKIAKPTVAVITNIGTSHIGNLGSRENILKAKLEILNGLKKDGVVVINNDNDLLHKWAEENKDKYKIITYGIENKSDFMAYDIKQEERNSTYKIMINNKEYFVKVPVGGLHFVYNSLSSIAVGSYLNINPDKMLTGIDKFELTKNRMDIIKNNKNVTIINDTYNASYDSMKVAIEYLGKQKNERKIAVLGDMLELGEYSKEMHEKVGEEICKNSINILLTVGEYSKYIASQAKENGMKKENIYICKNNTEAIGILKNILKSDDIVLVKASNSMKLGEIVEEIKNN